MNAMAFPRNIGDLFSEVVSTDRTCEIGNLGASPTMQEPDCGGMLRKRL